MAIERNGQVYGQIVYDPEAHLEFVKSFLQEADIPLATMPVEPGEDLPQLRVGARRHIGEQAIQAAVDELQSERGTTL